MVQFLMLIFVLIADLCERGKEIYLYFIPNGTEIVIKSHFNISIHNSLRI